MNKTAPVTLNADLGEGLGLHSFGNDEKLTELIDLANVACGFHAGDPSVMRQTVSIAIKNGVKIGAHPGLPDLAGFGRRKMQLNREEVRDLLLYQVGALRAFVQFKGDELHHIKPHGALYGMLAGDKDLMYAAAEVCQRFNLPFMGMYGTEHERVCAETGVEFIGELYVDLDYNDEGQLIIQRTPQQPAPEQVAARLKQALEQQHVESINGKQLPVRFDSVCVHSDGPQSVQIAQACAEVLGDHAVTPLGGTS
ncbi:5-oxoprolinase subunit PxpA [Staphylococcus chromogenes]|nr:5-oxoprolinase subunit PxpA [Staphylococcus chromogenes]